MIYENNEEKRSTLWRTVLTVSSVLIIIIAVFFIVKLFTGNPLEGKWTSEATGGTIEITDKDELIIQTEDQESSTIVRGFVDKKTKTLTVRGFVDKKTKTLTVGLSGEGPLDPEIEMIIGTGSYNYNVEQDTLTLTEREYGDQFVFERTGK